MVATKTQPTPQPGDVIAIDGVRHVIDSAYYGTDFEDGEGPVVLAVAAYSTFRGDGSSRYNPAGSVSASGGPCPFVPLDALVYVGTTEQEFWKWKDFPRAHSTVHYKVTVNLYERKP